MILDTKFVELAVLGFGLASGQTDFDGTSTYAKADNNLLPGYSIKNYDEQYLYHYHSVRSELRGYESLSENWDGYSATPPEKKYVELAEKLLDQVYQLGLPMPRPQINSDGEISLYWRDEVSYMEFAIESFDVASFYYKNRTTKKDYLLDDLPVSLGSDIAEIIVSVNARRPKASGVVALPSENKPQYKEDYLIPEFNLSSQVDLTNGLLAVGY